MPAGECYANAWKMLCGWGDELGPLVKLETNLGGEPLLVHGYPLLASGRFKDGKYGHAWIHLQRLGLVIDGGTKTLVSYNTYIEAGRIDESESARFTRQEAANLAIKTEGYGPWGDVPEGALFNEEN